MIKFITDITKRVLKITRSFIYFRKFNVLVHGKILVGKKKNIKIGKYCSINQGVIIQGFNEVVIGDFVILSPNCMLLDANIDIDHLTATGGRKHVPGSIQIGNNCWIGAGAIILPGVTLGPKTIVGAGSVVTKSFDGDVVIAGNPAHIIKKLS